MDVRPTDKLTWGFSKMRTSSGPSLSFSGSSWYPKLPFSSTAKKAEDPANGRSIPADCLACCLCLEQWEASEPAHDLGRSGNFCLCLSCYLPLPELHQLSLQIWFIEGSKDNFHLCVCMQLSVWATQQALRFRGRSICISERSRCCIISSNLEGKEKVRKNRPHVQ